MASEVQGGEPISILIAEDLELVRFGIKFALEKDPRVQVVGEAENGDQVLSFVEAHHPQVVLMDVGMPVMDGMQATRILKERFPETKVIMLTSRDQSATVYESLTAGADGYCLKGLSVEQLYPILENVLANRPHLDVEVASLILNDLQNDPTTSAQISESNMSLLLKIRDGDLPSQIAAAQGWTVEEFHARLGALLQTLCEIKESTPAPRRF